MDNRIRKEIMSAIISGVQRNGERIFNISQQTSSGYVPVDNGTLKRSGVSIYTPKGIIIKYTAPYSLVVETGIEQDIPIKGDQVIKMKNGRTRTLHNKRLIFIKRQRKSKFEWESLYRTDKGGKKKSGIFRTISVIKARLGQWYLKRATEEGLKYLVDDLVEELKFIRNTTVKKG